MRNIAHDAKRTDTEGGFTLLEVIVAIAILCFGILAVASMQVASIRGNALSGGLTAANTWAGDMIEKLTRLPWDDPQLQDTDGDGANGLDDTDFDSDPGTPDDADHLPVTQGAYTICWNVAEGVAAPQTKTISVIVTWLDHGVEKRVSIRNIISQLG